MTGTSLAQEWMVRAERGSLPLIKLGVRLALRMGRARARWFLYPISLYFLASSPAAARSSRRYLARVLGRSPRLTDVLRHYWTFASCVLDRAFLLNDEIGEFEVRVHGEEMMLDIERSGNGCMLFGAHFGSFEVARAIGHRRSVPISLLMYEENARKVRGALAAINPGLETEVLGLGRPGALIAVAERLRRGHFVGLLADRNRDARDLVRYPFLGAPAAFPRGPFRLAMLLDRPVVTVFGVYSGGRRYEVFFETLACPSDWSRPDREGCVEWMVERYVSRLEHYCRIAPFNWFNFYDFWA